MLAESVRRSTAPNPWVGCVIESARGERFEGATQPPGGKHAEIVALTAAGGNAQGATLYATLEPCNHHGRTGPCTEAIVEAGVARVVFGALDPDERVRGGGVERLQEAGIDVEQDPYLEAEATASLAPYLKHRRTGRPYVILKLAMSLDGRIAAPDGSSRWITGPESRADAHDLRAASDAVLVGAGTVRADDPALTVRHVDGRDPIRVVLGRAPAEAKVHPAIEMEGDLETVLDELGGKGVLQLLVEGGASVAHGFHAAGLVDRYVFYIAPMLFGGDDARAMFAGPGAATMADVWRGRVKSVTRLGDDIRLDLEPGGDPCSPG